MNSKILVIAAWILVIGGEIFLITKYDHIINPSKEQQHTNLVDTIKRSEICYDGVVYIKMHRLFSVKFNRNNTVATCK